MNRINHIQQYFRSFPEHISQRKSPIRKSSLSRSAYRVSFRVEAHLAIAPQCIPRRVLNCGWANTVVSISAYTECVWLCVCVCVCGPGSHSQTGKSICSPCSNEMKMMWIQVERSERLAAWPAFLCGKNCHGHGIFRKLERKRRIKREKEFFPLAIDRHPSGAYNTSRYTHIQREWLAAQCTWATAYVMQTLPEHTFCSTCISDVLCVRCVRVWWATPPPTKWIFYLTEWIYKFYIVTKS